MPTYDGLPACRCQVRWLKLFTALLALFGIKVRWTQLIGGYIKSGGTHVTGGASDAIIASPGRRSRSAAYKLLVKLARLAGADASWHRPKNWDNAGGIEHAHLVLTACRHRSRTAVDQTRAVRAGLNGLANGGRDTGYRPLSMRSWSQGLGWMRDQIKAKSKSAPKVYRVYLGENPDELRLIVRQGPGNHYPPVLDRKGRPKTLRHGDKITVVDWRKTKSGAPWAKGTRGGSVPGRRLRPVKK